MRFAGSIVDGLLTTLAMIPGLGLMFAFVQNGDEDLSMIGMGVAMLGALAFSAYQWYLTATTGQTLAKRWFGMKIVKVDGSDVDFVSGVILRVWIIGAINMFVNFASLVDVLFIFGADSRCLHDYIAGTRVIMVQ
jgi:uncharacterized RDD family membrane protein YckC